MAVIDVYKRQEHEGPGNFHPPLFTVGEVPGELVGFVCQTRELKGFPSFTRDLRFLPLESRGAKQTAEQRIPAVLVISNAQIVQNREILEQADVLEGAGNPVPVSYTHLDVYKRQG